MKKNKFKCSKCLKSEFKTGEIRTAGGFWTKIFDIQNEKFSYISCANCSYTEFYSVKSSGPENIFDVFTM